MWGGECLIGFNMLKKKINFLLSNSHGGLAINNEGLKSKVLFIIKYKVYYFISIKFLKTGQILCRWRSKISEQWMTRIESTIELSNSK